MHKFKKKKELGKHKAIHLNTHRHTYMGGEGGDGHAFKKYGTYY